MPKLRASASHVSRSSPRRSRHAADRSRYARSDSTGEQDRQPWPPRHPEALVPLPRLLPGQVRLRSSNRGRGGCRRGHLLEARVNPGEPALKHLPFVEQQMPPVGNLPGAWRPYRGPRAYSLERSRTEADLGAETAPVLPPVLAKPKVVKYASAPSDRLRRTSRPCVHTL